MELPAIAANKDDNSSQVNGVMKSSTILAKQNGHTEELLSAESSSSDFSELELPRDIPDGPEFQDLAAHLDRVKAQVLNEVTTCAMNGTVPDLTAYAVPSEAACSPHMAVDQLFVSAGSEPLATHHFTDWAQADTQAGDVCDSVVEPNAEALDDLNSDEDDFGEFEGPITTPSETLTHTEEIQSSVPSSQPSGILERLLSRLEPTLARAFETASEPTHPCHLSSSKPGQSPECNVQSCLWSKLIPPTRARQFRYRWDKSVIYEGLLNSIHMDRTYLPSVQTDQLQPLQPVPVHPPNQSTVHISSPVKPALPSTQPPSPEKPTDNKPILPADLDLDFLEQQSNQTSKQSKPITLSAFELDLLSRTSDPASHMNKKNTTPLASSTSQSSSSATTKQMGANVRAALSRLPKLTYMRARHLLFPVSDPTHN